MKRMFSKRIVDADRFLDLPAAARLLYYELNLRCDDDGFCSSPRSLLRATGAGKGDLQTLLDAGLLLDFDGIIVVTDWRIHNSLRADRLQTLSFPSLAEKIWITEDGSYVYGIATAEDAGHPDYICGNRLDLFFNTKAECVSFGAQPCDVYILG